MKLRPLPGLIAALITAALCCTGCFQELPLGDKYLNEAVGFLRVQNTSASYRFTGFELRDANGEIIKTWEVPGEDGKGLKPGETWTGDLDREGSFILYCIVWHETENSEGRYEYGAVSIKLHDVAKREIVGENFFTDTDKDGFSDSWETANGFDPADPADGGAVYVSAAAENDLGQGTAANPYKSLTKGLWKARYGLTDAARTVIAEGPFSDTTEGGSNTALFHITDTGPRGITIRGVASLTSVDAKGSSANMRRPFYLGPGTKLSLENIAITGGNVYRGGGFHAKGAVLTLGNGAVIQNCNTQSGASSGGGVYAEDGATVIMKSGSLIGDDNVSVGENNGYDKSTHGWMGVGVALINGSTLTMEGGSRITGNLFTSGGAVHADLGSSIILEDGAEITKNKDKLPAITHGKNHGGGVRLTRGSKLLMKGGLISGNLITKDATGGGGVYVGSESVFEMRGGKISGNIVGQIDTSQGAHSNPIGNGGGVYVDAGGQFNMSGGEIAGNTASGLGGGVYVDGGVFIKTRGIIYGSDHSSFQNTMGRTPASNALHITNSGSINTTLSDSDPITYP
jgi:hypothetical protein